MEQNYCLIDLLSNTVTNIIYWNGNLDQWSPPEGSVVIQSDTADIGWTYDFENQIFINPNANANSYLISANSSTNTDGPNVIIE